MEQVEKSSETGSNSGSNPDTLVLDDEVTNRLDRITLSALGAKGTITTPIGQTIPSPLTFDCLEEIIRHLIDDRPTLFSCALVNRSWCRIAISLLWCRPFDHISTRKFSQIIRTYVSFLPETVKQQLMPFGIRLPDTPASSKPLLFNYPRYLKSFDISNFQDGLYFLFRFHADPEAIQLCVQVLGRFIFEQIDGLKLLKIVNPTDSLMDLSKLEGMHAKLRSLESVEFNLNWMDIKNALERFRNLCSVLSHHSYYLKQISIVYNLQIKHKEILNLLWELIEVQHNLESVTTMEFWNPNNRKFIYDILKTQSHSLKYLGISGVRNAEKLLELIKVCKELKTLEIFGFKELDPRMIASNSTNSDDNNNSDVTHQIKLGKLVCDDTSSGIAAPTIGVIIKMSNVHLQELILNDLTMELIECIQRQCPNLKKFCASIRCSLSPQFYPVLESMKKLEYLYLQTRYEAISVEELEKRRLRRTDASKDRMNVMAFVKSLPSTLLHLEVDFNISAGGLKMLFEECKIGLRTLILYNFILNEEVMKSVVEYARRVGTLRKFRYGRSWNSKVFEEIMGDVMDEARNVIGNIGFIEL